MSNFKYGVLHTCIRKMNFGIAKLFFLKVKQSSILITFEIVNITLNRS